MVNILLAALLLLPSLSFAEVEPISVTANGSNISPAEVAASTVTITGTGSKCFSVDDPTFVVDCNLGNVGIGDSTPTNILDIKDPDATATIGLANASQAADFVTLTAAGGLNFGTGSLANALKITAAGFHGIGTTGDAATKLHMSSGTLTVDGTAAGVTVTNAAGVGDIFRAGTGGTPNGVYARYINSGVEFNQYDSAANGEAAGVTGRGSRIEYGLFVNYSGGEFAWSSTADAAGAQDTNLSRISAGVVGVGTGAAGSAAGNLNLAGMTLDKGTGVGQVTLDGSTGGCIMLRDTDDAGWTECDALDGTLSCSVDADGVCD